MNKITHPAYELRTILQDPRLTISKAVKMRKLATDNALPWIELCLEANMALEKLRQSRKTVE